MSEEVILFGVDLKSAQELLDLIRGAGFEADDVYHWQLGDPHRRDHDSFAIHRDVRSVFVNWSDDIAIAEPLWLRPEGVEPPVVMIRYRGSTLDLLFDVLEIVAPLAAIVDNTDGIALPGREFAEKLQDPDVDLFGRLRLG